MREKAFKYIFSGGVGFASNLLLFWILTDYLSVWYVAASVLSFALSTLASFFLHKHVTYADTSKTRAKKVFAYYALSVLNIAVNAVLVFVLVDLLHMDKFFSLAFSSMLIALYSYVIYQKYVFK